MDFSARAPWLSLLAPALLTCSMGCSSSDTAVGAEATKTGDGGPSGGGKNGGASGGGGASATSGGGFSGQTLQGTDAAAVVSQCPDAQCWNGKDDDGDGLVDGFDPECTGPCDNDEGSFATGIPGDNVDPKWQDCFFDGNSGGGDDGCRYATGCITGDLPQTDKSCTLSQQCLDFCMPLISNGCDCFGCCTVATPAGPKDIRIGTSCSLDKAGDATACPSCVKSTTCNNPCGTCELCPGKTAADLPASCAPPPPVAPPDGAPPPPPPPAYTCDGVRQVVCSDTQPCPAGNYCQLGCCRAVVR